MPSVYDGDADVIHIADGAATIFRGARSPGQVDKGVIEDLRSFVEINSALLKILLGFLRIVFNLLHVLPPE